MVHNFVSNCIKIKEKVETQRKKLTSNSTMPSPQEESKTLEGKPKSVILSAISIGSVLDLS